MLGVLRVCRFPLASAGLRVGARPALGDERRCVGISALCFVASASQPGQHSDFALAGDCCIVRRSDRTDRPHQCRRRARVAMARWGGWLGSQNRCVVPATSFCEYADTKPHKTPTWIEPHFQSPYFKTASEIAPSPHAPRFRWFRRSSCWPEVTPILGRLPGPYERSGTTSGQRGRRHRCGAQQSERGVSG